MNNGVQPQYGRPTKPPIANNQNVPPHMMGNRDQVNGGRGRETTQSVPPRRHLTNVNRYDAADQQFRKMALQQQQSENEEFNNGQDLEDDW